MRAPTAVLLCLALLSCQGLGQIGETPGAKRDDRHPVRVLIAYYSLTANTEKMAQAVVEGVKRIEGTAAVLKKVDEVTKEDIEGADGIILGCPAYYGTIPGKMKVAIDDWWWKLKVDFTDKVGGAFSTGGGQVGGKPLHDAQHSLHQPQG